MTTKPKRKTTRKPAQPKQPSPFKADKPRLATRIPAYTEELAQLICRRIENGESLRAICEENGMPDRGTVFRWLDKYPDFATIHAQARARQQDAFAEDTVHIADTEPDPARARVRVAARQWLAERLAPKKYGNKVEHTGTGSDGAIVVRFEAADEGLM